MSEVATEKLDAAAQPIAIFPEPIFTTPEPIVRTVDLISESGRESGVAVEHLNHAFQRAPGTHIRVRVVPSPDRTFVRLLAEARRELGLTKTALEGVKLDLRRALDDLVREGGDAEADREVAAIREHDLEVALRRRPRLGHDPRSGRPVVYVPFYSKTGEYSVMAQPLGRTSGSWRRSPSGWELRGAGRARY